MRCVKKKTHTLLMSLSQLHLWTFGFCFHSVHLVWLTLFLQTMWKGLWGGLQCESDNVIPIALVLESQS